MGSEFIIRVLLFMKVYYKSLITISVCFLCTPILMISNAKDYRCCYAILVMFFLWVTESLPLPVTSMLPIVLFPLLNVLESTRVAQCYLQETTVTMLGSIIILIGVVQSGLHVRLALTLLNFFGYTHARLCFGFAVTTTLLSMLIPNPAVVTIMLPIIDRVLQMLYFEDLAEIYDLQTSQLSKSRQQLSTMTIMPSGISLLPHPSMTGHPKALVYDYDSRIPRFVGEIDRPPSNIALCYYLQVAYASTIGSTGTFIATGGNMAYKALYQSMFPQAPKLQFPTFMIHNCPIILIMQILVYIYLQWLYMGLFRPLSTAAKNAHIGAEGRKIIESDLKEQYEDLGAFTYNEKVAGSIWLVAVLLFVTKKPHIIFNGGWHVLNEMIDGYSVNAIFMVMVSFMIPKKATFMVFFKKYLSKERVPKQSSEGFISWKSIQNEVPWGLITLLGAGYAITEALKVTNADILLISKFEKAMDMPQFCWILVVMVTCKAISEFSSSIALINVSLPFVAHLAIAKRIHPTMLMLAATFGSIMVFHFPHGSPSNGLVSNFAQIPIHKMAKAGIGPSIFCIICLCVAITFWTPVLISNQFPKWAELNNTKRN